MINGKAAPLNSCKLILVILLIYLCLYSLEPLLQLLYLLTRISIIFFVNSLQPLKGISHAINHFYVFCRRVCGGAGGQAVAAEAAAVAVEASSAPSGRRRRPLPRPSGEPPSVTPNGTSGGKNVVSLSPLFSLPMKHLQLY